MELTTEPILSEITHVGIRMNNIVPVFTSRSTDINPAADLDNVFISSVTSVMENPFSFVINVRPVNKEEADSIGWETKKELWNLISSDHVSISLPKENLLLLNDSDKEIYYV